MLLALTRPSIYAVMYVFTAHSVRGASSSVAANIGIMTNDILKAADWSSESVFQKFYYKPVEDPSFGRPVLSSRN